MGDGDEIAMDRWIYEMEFGQPALARAEELARTAQLQILLGDAESILGFPKDLQPRPRRLAERGLIEQKAGRAGLAPADASAELVELGEAEALRMLDHHDRGGRHIDADLDHSGGDQKI